MDALCIAVLDKIFSLGAPGRNIVISEEEFFDVFPEGYTRSDTELRKTLKSLLSGGYIDIKYSGGDMYCVTPIKNREVEEPPQPEAAPTTAQPEPTTYTLKISFLPAFFAALAGSALGAAIISVIFYFL